MLKICKENYVFNILTYVVCCVEDLQELCFQHTYLCYATFLRTPVNPYVHNRFFLLEAAYVCKNKAVASNAAYQAVFVPAAMRWKSCRKANTRNCSLHIYTHEKYNPQMYFSYTKSNLDFLNKSVIHQLFAHLDGVCSR